ncbi:serine/arginine repetitive matrix protein 2-like [Cuculus canorus]|uniref:serine/arginine repetitive matrix protein 2-like n=1 Tax=Cuculus canorus TaxID=55661 RepID=UPI0023AA9166|nr:serine/arginine repetitive matrix protein 2-like [Cuculus canorus]
MATPSPRDDVMETRKAGRCRAALTSPRAQAQGRGQRCRGDRDASGGEMAEVPPRERSRRDVPRTPVRVRSVRAGQCRAVPVAPGGDAAAGDVAAELVTRVMDACADAFAARQVSAHRRRMGPRFRALPAFPRRVPMPVGSRHSAPSPAGMEPQDSRFPAFPRHVLPGMGILIPEAPRIPAPCPGEGTGAAPGVPAFPTCASAGVGPDPGGSGIPAPCRGEVHVWGIPGIPSPSPTWAEGPDPGGSWRSGWCRVGAPPAPCGGRGALRCSRRLPAAHSLLRALGVRHSPARRPLALPGAGRGRRRRRHGAPGRGAAAVPPGLLRPGRRPRPAQPQPGLCCRSSGPPCAARAAQCHRPRAGAAPRRAAARRGHGVPAPPGKGPPAHSPPHTPPRGNSAAAAGPAAATATPGRGGCQWPRTATASLPRHPGCAPATGEPRGHRPCAAAAPAAPPRAMDPPAGGGAPCGRRGRGIGTRSRCRRAQPGHRGAHTGTAGAAAPQTSAAAAGLGAGARRHRPVEQQTGERGTAHGARRGHRRRAGPAAHPPRCALRRAALGPRRALSGSSSSSHRRAAPEALWRRGAIAALAPDGPRTAPAQPRRLCLCRTNHEGNKEVSVVQLCPLPMIPPALLLPDRHRSRQRGARPGGAGSPRCPRPQPTAAPMALAGWDRGAAVPWEVGAARAHPRAVAPVLLLHPMPVGVSGSGAAPVLRCRGKALSDLRPRRTLSRRSGRTAAMEVPSGCSHPGWFVLALVLALWLWVRRRRCWDPRRCPADLTGKTVIVTGANSGIGKCVALDLARRNARTILACRSRERGEAAAAEIRAATGNPAVVVRVVDTASLASVRAFARAVLREETRLDVLVNNAGSTGLPFAVTPEGLERTFATNYVGTFLLTRLLLDLLKASAPARIVNVSSFRHRAGTADCRFLTGQARPGSFDAAYNSTKLMNVLFTAELARRLRGTGVTANALSPGVVSTGIMRHFGCAVRALFALARPFIKSAERGAASTIFCAVSEEAAGISGKYFDSECGLALPAPAARDAALARKLWEETERLTGLHGASRH